MQGGTEQNRADCSQFSWPRFDLFSSIRQLLVRASFCFISSVSLLLKNPVNTAFEGPKGFKNRGAKSGASHVNKQRYLFHKYRLIRASPDTPSDQGPQCPATTFWGRRCARTKGRDTSSTNDRISCPTASLV